jgi:4-hydroxybenzoate polyprenyltransferase
MLKQIISLLRIKHWIKNILIFLPAFFGGVIKDFSNFSFLCLIFLFFSLTASLVYIFNDLLDLEKDKLHPAKRKRALASGTISKNGAYLIIIVLVSVLISLSFLLPINVVITTSFYLFMNILYSINLKKIPILELFIIAFGFVFRILIGGFGVDVEPSKWIIMLTFFAALYLIISKRRGELLNEKAMNSREVLKHYSLDYLNLAMIILVTVSIMAYIMYTVEPVVISNFSTDKIYLTSFIVIFVLLRHLQQTIIFNNTESPVEYFYKDRINLIAILIWLLTFYALIYIT